MFPLRLASLGVAGPDIGRLQRAGRPVLAGRTVTLDEVSEARRGQRFAFVMDTRLCDAAFALAEGVDMLVIEATFLAADAGLAAAYRRPSAATVTTVAAVR